MMRVVASGAGRYPAFGPTGEALHTTMRAAGETLWAGPRLLIPRRHCDERCPARIEDSELFRRCLPKSTLLHFALKRNRKIPKSQTDAEQLARQVGELAGELRRVAG